MGPPKSVIRAPTKKVKKGGIFESNPNTVLPPIQRKIN
jgi:hypothetical protein